MSAAGVKSCKMADIVHNPGPITIIEHIQRGKGGNMLLCPSFSPPYSHGDLLNSKHILHYGSDITSIKVNLQNYAVIMLHHSSSQIKGPTPWWACNLDTYFPA